MTEKTAAYLTFDKEFVTLQKMEDGYWLVKAVNDKNQTTVIEKLKYLPDGVYSYSKLGKELATSLSLPFVKANETPEKLYRKEKRKLDKRNFSTKKETARQNNLKQQWQVWRKKFKNEEVALAEGIYACEKLARDLEVSVAKVGLEYYLFCEPIQDENLSRLAQFNELKNLWLRRNQSKILTVTPLACNYSVNSPQGFAFNNFWDETFFSYFETTQLYLYEVKIGEKFYPLFSDKIFPANSAEVEEVTCSYGKCLASDEKRKIGTSFGQLVPVIEWGARNFWKVYWSKQENRLLPCVDKK